MLKKTIIAIFIFLTLLLAVSYITKLDAIFWYLWDGYTAKDDDHALGLKDYHVTIDGLQIPNIANASGLTFNYKTNTLYTVLNKESEVIELDLNGNVLRSLHIKGVADLEGITFVGNSQYVVADERDGRLILLTIEDGATEVDAANAPSLAIDEYVYGNKNFEGISWDEDNDHLIVVKERDPKFVLAVTGFVDAVKGAPINIKIKKLIQYEKAIQWSMRDLSSVEFHSTNKHLFLLSDESKLLKEIDELGHTVGVLAMWKGLHGLKSSVPQAEGIAIDHENNVYVISEPNLFYRFEKKEVK